MAGTPERGVMRHYRDAMNRRMAMLSAADLREDIYLVPLRAVTERTGGSHVLSGQAWLGVPGRYLTFELCRIRSDGQTFRYHGRLLGLTLPGPSCEAELGTSGGMASGTALMGVFDFAGCKFDVRILPFPGPHPVVCIAALARRDSVVGKGERA